MIRRFVTAATLAVLVACGSYSPTSPSAGGSSGGGYGGGGGTGGGSMGGGSTGGNNGGGSTGGDTGGSNGGGAAPTTAAVIVGNNFFKSGHNGSLNTAVDTIAAGGTVTWTWTSSGVVPHSIESLGSPSFASSAVLTGNGSKYQVIFATAGTYQYDCAIHGTMMSGRIVVR
jgi:plastocyanin